MVLRSLVFIVVCSGMFLPFLTGCSTPSAGLPMASARAGSQLGVDVAMYALMLRDTGYKFGGKNPEAGLDCSGMVAYVYQQVTGKKVTGNAAMLARLGQEVDSAQLQAGDLVFFNTMNKPSSHVGIYLGNGEFIHAPSTNGRVRVDRLTNPYYAKRFEMGRTLLD